MVRSRIKASFDYTGDGLDDGYGHGTHVAGIIGGNASDSNCSVCNVTIKGIAPNVNLISFRVLNNQGEGTESQVIQAIQAAIQLKSSLQHSSHQSVGGSPGVRELHARSALPGG